MAEVAVVARTRVVLQRRCISARQPLARAVGPCTAPLVVAKVGVACHPRFRGVLLWRVVAGRVQVVLRRTPRGLRWMRCWMRLGWKWSRLSEGLWGRQLWRPLPFRSMVQPGWRSRRGRLLHGLG